MVSQASLATLPNKNAPFRSANGEMLHFFFDASLVISADS
jgi:hypothetical protein